MMSDLRTILERGIGGATPPPDGFERMLHRRDRKRRNQRIAAGIVGVAVFVAAVWIVRDVALLNQTKTKVTPAERGVTADNGFRGRYRVTALDDTCPFHSSWYRVRIRYVSERVRTYDRFAPGSGWALMYVRGERFPWQRQGGSPVELRYDPRTDTAIGIQQGPQCPRWRVRLVPIG
jgi:hypothetical protein